MRLLRLIFLTFLLLPFGQVFADEYSDAINKFRKAGASSQFFSSAYGYAVFPNIGKAGLGFGGAYGEGRVYRKGKHSGDATMTQVTFGIQFGGQAYSQVIFFKNKAAYDKFISGKFEFGAQATAVAITAGASASAGTTGQSAGASLTENTAGTVGANYENGMLTFTIARGGLMYEASMGGQKFSFKPK